jgi:hypothetical protein
MANNGAVTITPGTINQAIAQGYHNGSGIIQGDSDLIASNIKTGINIFGVVGTLIPGYQLITGTVTTPSSAVFLKNQVDSNYNGCYFVQISLPSEPAHISCFNNTNDTVLDIDLDTNNIISSHYQVFFPYNNSKVNCFLNNDISNNPNKMWWNPTSKILQLALLNGGVPVSYKIYLK